MWAVINRAKWNRKARSVRHVLCGTQDEWRRRVAWQEITAASLAPVSQLDPLSYGKQRLGRWEGFLFVFVCKCITLLVDTFNICIPCTELLNESPERVKQIHLQTI